MTLYTIGCPQCRVLEQKLKTKGFEFNVNTNVEEMKKLGMMGAPMLDTGDGKFLNFTQALEWLKAQEKAE